MIFDDGISQFVPGEWIEPIKVPKYHRESFAQHHTPPPTLESEDESDVHESEDESEDDKSEYSDTLETPSQSPKNSHPKVVEVDGVIIEEIDEDTGRVPPERRLPDDSMYVLEEIPHSSL